MFIFLIKKQGDFRLDLIYPSLNLNFNNIPTLLLLETL